MGVSSVNGWMGSKHHWWTESPYIHFLRRASFLRGFHQAIDALGLDSVNECVLQAHNV